MKKENSVVEDGQKYRTKEIPRYRNSNKDNEVVRDWVRPMRPEPRVSSSPLGQMVKVVMG